MKKLEDTADDENEKKAARLQAEAEAEGGRGRGGRGGGNEVVVGGSPGRRRWTKTSYTRRWWMAEQRRRWRQKIMIINLCTKLYTIDSMNQYIDLI